MAFKIRLQISSKTPGKINVGILSAVIALKMMRLVQNHMGYIIAYMIVDVSHEMVAKYP